MIAESSDLALTESTQTEEVPQRHPRVLRRETTWDSLFLIVVMLLSTSPYLTRLGFYSDDWAFLGVMSTSQDQSLLGLWAQQYVAYPNLRLRPTQITHQAVLYSLFGTHPLGYHVANAIVITVMTVVLYRVLRQLRLPRTIALSVPLIYGLLPNYSTDRFWFAAFGYALSMCLCLTSIYADLRAIGSKNMLRWKLLSLGLLAAAGFGYEVVLPLLAVSPVISWIQAKRVLPGGLRQRTGRWGQFIYVLSPLFALVLIVIYKSTAVEGTALPSNLRLHFIWVAVGSIVTNFGTYGAGLPYAVWWSLTSSSWGITVTGLLAGLSIFAYLAWVLRQSSAPLPSRSGWLGLGALGVTVFVLGYSIFLATGRVDFSSTGISNRTAFAAALGVSFVLLSILGWISSFAPSDRVRHRVWALSVAVLCSSSFLVVSALGNFWKEAWRTQQEVMTAIRHEVPVLPRQSTLILHGVCPYAGPAVIFESPWDLRGALQVAYDDKTLRADVTSSHASLKSRGLYTSLYGGAISTFHRYDEHLLLLDYRTRTVESLIDESHALDQLGTRHPQEPHDCPSGEEGIGVEIFPIDSRYHRTSLYRSLEGR